MIAKQPTTGMSFHRVCETVSIICLLPLRETINTLFRREKDEVLANLRMRTGFNRNTFNLRLCKSVHFIISFSLHNKVALIGS